MKPTALLTVCALLGGNLSVSSQELPPEIPQSEQRPPRSEVPGSSLDSMLEPTWSLSDQLADWRIGVHVAGQAWSLDDVVTGASSSADGSSVSPRREFSSFRRLRGQVRVELGIESLMLFGGYLQDQVELSDPPAADQRFDGNGWTLGAHGHVQFAEEFAWFYEGEWAQARSTGDANVTDVTDVVRPRPAQLHTRELTVRSGIVLGHESIRPSLGLLYTRLDGELDIQGFPRDGSLSTRALATYIAVDLGERGSPLSARIEALFGSYAGVDNVRGVAARIAFRF